MLRSDLCCLDKATQAGSHEESELETENQAGARGNSWAS